MNELLDSKTNIQGRLAQSVERNVSIVEVGGSKPSLSKNVAVWRNWTARLTTDQEVPGSSPGMVVNIKDNGWGSFIQQFKLKNHFKNETSNK